MKKAMWMMAATLLLLVGGVANAGIIADAYEQQKKGIEVEMVIHYSLFLLPVKIVSGNMVTIDRCVGGAGVNRAARATDFGRAEVERNVDLTAFRNAIRRYYPAADVSVTNVVPCSMDPQVNRILLFHAGPSGDPLFFNAVEQVLKDIRYPVELRSKK